MKANYVQQHAMMCAKKTADHALLGLDCLKMDDRTKQGVMCALISVQLGIAKQVARWKPNQLQQLSKLDDEQCVNWAVANCGATK